MKKILMLVLLFGASLYAYDYNSDSNDDANYESSSGNQYKYDLSDPSDRLEYSVDVGAQLDDSVNPSVGLDRSLGEYGGGIVND
jgi:hypothetical protein